MIYVWIVLALLVIWLIATYNGLIRSRNRVDEAWSDIEVQLKRRYDLIPNLVNTVKGYAAHEKGLFEEVTKARSQAMSATNVHDRLEKENMLSSTLKSLFAVAENYPDLKANSNFMAIVYDHISENKQKTALLLGAFFVLIIGLGFVFSQAYGSPEILYIAVGFSICYALISYYFSANITLSLSRAHAVDRSVTPELYQVIENLCITAGLPTPKIYIIEDTAINAFATGRNPQNAVIVFTTGILQKLNKTELEGVAAHELSHIGNYDIRLMTLVVVLVGLLTLLADFFLRFSFHTRGGRSRNNQAQLIFMVAGIALALLSPIIASIIQLAISRKREFLADSSGILLTRYPEGLASALEKISLDTEPLEAANKATAHLYIANPLRNRHNGIGWFAGLFNTHPPIEERVRRLRGMA